MSDTSRDILLGIDVGTTSMKALALDRDGVVLGSAQAPTIWDVAADGTVEMPVERLADAAIGVLAEAARNAGGRVLGVGIAGLAETGVVVDAQGRALTPAIAWYDQRGKDQLAALPASFRDEFSAVTGLAAKAECSFSKLLWWHAQGRNFSGSDMWLNALEYIAYALTGARATEPSLASRTGLLDQATITPWSGALNRIGLDPSFLPPMVDAGTAIGIVGGHAPDVLVGAAVSVGGHDHLVASVGAGAVAPDALFDSCGTADVILRSLPRTLTNDERAWLVERGLSAGRHCIAGSTAIIGATRSGLVLGRVLSMLGAQTLDERVAIADTWHPGDAVSPNVTVSEPPNWTNEVTIRIREYVTPADVWGAAMAYVLDDTVALLDPIAHVAGDYQSAFAAGGWAHLGGVFRGKAAIMPSLRLSSVELPGAQGAALFAAHAAGITDGGLAARLPHDVSPKPTKELVP